MVREGVVKSGGDFEIGGSGSDGTAPRDYEVGFGVVGGFGKALRWTVIELSEKSAPGTHLSATGAGVEVAKRGTKVRSGDGL